MTTTALLAIGLLLCFGGARSLRLAVLAGGAGLGWVIATAFGSSAGTAALVALGAAVVCLVLSVVVSRFVILGLGAVLGAQIGASGFAVLSEDPSWLLAVVFVLAFAAVGALLAEKYHQAFIGWAAALAGASIVLTGLEALDGETGDGLKDAGSGWAAALYVVLWIGLTVAGRYAQRRPREE